MFCSITNVILFENTWGLTNICMRFFCQHLVCGTLWRTASHKIKRKENYIFMKCHTNHDMYVSRSGFTSYQVGRYAVCTVKAACRKAIKMRIFNTNYYFPTN